MCSKCPPPTRIRDLRLSRHWSIAASIMFCSKSTQVCLKRFASHRCHRSFFVHSLLHNTPNFTMYRSISLKRIRYIWCNFLWQYPTVTVHFQLFWFSQGSVATLSRWGRWSSYHHMYRSSTNLRVKSALKFVDFSRSYRQNKLAPFYGSRCIAH